MAKQIAAKEMLERIKDVVPDIAEQCSRNENQKAITNNETDMKVLNMYNKFFGSIVPDKTVDIGNYSKTLQMLMTKNELTYADFSKSLRIKTEESLTEILDKLNLSHFFYEIQEDPAIVALSLNTDTPFTTIGMASTIEAAKAEALCKAFETMQLFMQL